MKALKGKKISFKQSQTTNQQLKRSSIDSKCELPATLMVINGPSPDDQPTVSALRV